MESASTSYNDLSNHLEELAKKFIFNYLDEHKTNKGNLTLNNEKYLLKADANESDYQFDVQAYIVLAHAAFEDYFEKIAKDLMIYSLKKWNDEKIITDIMLMQVAYYVGENDKLVLTIDDKSKDKADKLKNLSKFENHIKGLQGKAKYFFESQIERNHGITIEKYLLKLLIPVAIDINYDADIENAINQLKNYRGKIAHKSGKAISEQPNPLHVYKVVLDCLKLCEDIKEQCLNK